MACFNRGEKSSSIATGLFNIYKEHGPPRVLHHYQGREFDGAFAEGPGEHYECLADDNQEPRAADKSESDNVPRSLLDEQKADEAEDSHNKGRGGGQRKGRSLV